MTQEKKFDARVLWGKTNDAYGYIPEKIRLNDEERKTTIATSRHNNIWTSEVYDGADLKPFTGRRIRTPEEVQLDEAEHRIAFSTSRSGL